METTAALTTNTFKVGGNLKSLDGNILNLQADYEVMKKNREQAKADLQAKFDDVYSKITDTKQMFIKQSVEQNAKVQAFMKRFNSEVETLEHKQNEQHISFATNNDKRLNILDLGIKTLDQAIEQERLDRIRTEQQNIAAIQSSIDQLVANFDLEKDTRVANEKKIMENIKNTSKKINTQIEDEAKEKTDKLNQLKAHTSHMLNNQEKYSNGFMENATKEFHQQIDSIEGEMDNRFAQQDNVVDDLRQVISTIQKTLVILGKDV